MKPHFFLVAIIAGLGIFAAVAVMGGSETDLVNASYLCIPLIAFGVFGMMAAKQKRKGSNPVLFGLMMGAGSGVLLWLFYEAIWPML